MAAKQPPKPPTAGKSAAKTPAKPPTPPLSKGATAPKIARVKAARPFESMTAEYAKRERAFQLEPEAGVREKRMRDRGLRQVKPLKSKYMEDARAEKSDRIRRGLSEFGGTQASDNLRKARESSGVDYNLREASKLKMQREAAGRAAVKASDAKLTKAAKKVYRPSGGDMRGMFMGGGGTSKNK